MRRDRRRAAFSPSCPIARIEGSRIVTTVKALRSRWALALVIAALAAALVVAVPAIWQPILRAAGWALVVEEPLAPADIIVITLDSGGAGVLEAADLVRGGIATRVAVFTDPPSGEDHEFIRRGLPYEDVAARSIRQLALLGVTAVERIPKADAGTSGEVQVLPAWCDEHGFGSIVLVSTADHTRRLRRAIDRSMKGHQTRITIRGSRYSTFDPDRWWETRDSVRTAIIEFQKLTLDLIMHPLQRWF